MTYNMLRFMDWPEDTLAGHKLQLNLCIVGKGQLGVAMDALHGKTVKGKTIAVQHIGLNNSVTGCEVLILSDLERSAMLSRLERVQSSAVLTVSDSAGFAHSGGVVGFILQGSKVRFEINQTAAQRHRIRISAQLLKLASIVQDD